MSWNIGSETIKLPDDIPDMIAAGRKECVRHIYSFSSHTVDRTNRANPENHIEYFKSLLSIVDLVMQRVAEGEQQNQRRFSFGLMTMSTANYYAWTDFFGRNGYAPERLRLGDQLSQYETVASGKLLKAVTGLIDRQAAENGKQGGYILLPHEEALRGTIKWELERMKEFQDDTWFLQPIAGPRSMSSRALKV